MFDGKRLTIIIKDFENCICRCDVLWVCVELMSSRGHMQFLSASTEGYTSKVGLVCFY